MAALMAREPETEVLCGDEIEVRPFDASGERSYILRRSDLVDGDLCHTDWTNVIIVLELMAHGLATLAASPTAPTFAQMDRRRGLAYRFRSIIERDVE